MSLGVFKLMAFKRSGFKLLAVVFSLLAMSWTLQSVYIQAKARIAQYLLEQAWQDSARKGDINKPWPWADTWPVARLSVPSLGRSLIVLEGASGEAMAFGPARVAAPLMRQAGITVISGHRDTHLAFLQEMQAGDLLVLETADGTTETYQWSSHSIADADYVKLRLNPNHRGLVLITCYPFNATQTGGSMRFVMMASRV